MHGTQRMLVVSPTWVMKPLNGGSGEGVTVSQVPEASVSEGQDRGESTAIRRTG